MSNNSVKMIQQALIAKGFLPGEVDGIWGRKTNAAVKAFQATAGLDVDGIVGPKTSAALFFEPGTPPVSIPHFLPWLAEAENLVDTKEVLGDRDNPVILDWASDLEIHYNGDEVPWCGLFVAHCIGATMPDETLPANPLGARQWERFGTSTEPRLGAVMVFWRESPHSGKGHVGFYTGENEDKSAFRILGGNQDNKVCFTWVGKNRFLKARWPHTATVLGGGEAIVVMNKEIDLSQNEA